MRKLFAVFIVLTLIVGSGLVLAEQTKPEVQVTLLNQDPDPIKQGEVVEVRFKIENVGEATSSDVQVQIIPNYPFSLYSGIATKNIGKLRASQTGADAVIVDYKLRVDEDAAEGDNEIELKIKVDSDTWHIYTKDDFLIDVEDYNFPELKIYVRDSDLVSAGQKGSVTIEIANTDLEDVKFLQFMLMENEGYQILSTSNYIYMGDIDSDDTESEEFEIFVSGSAGDSILLPIKLEYQDTNEKVYEKEHMLKLRLYSNDEAKKLGLKSDGRGTIISIVIVVVLIFGYFWWKKKKRR